MATRFEEAMEAFNEIEIKQTSSNHMAKCSNYNIDGREKRSCISPVRLIQMLEQVEFLILSHP